MTNGLSDYLDDELLMDMSGEGYGVGIEVEALDGGVPVVGHSGGDTGFSADVRLTLGSDVISVFLTAVADADSSPNWRIVDDVYEETLC